MTNGDRLTGRILERDEDTVLLQTAYAGIIAIEQSKVRSLSREPAQAGIGAAQRPNAESNTVVDGWELNRRQLTRVRNADRSSIPARAGSGKASLFTAGSALRGRLNLALGNQKGNTNKNELDVDYQVEYRRAWHRLRSLGAFELDTNDGEKTTDKWATHNQYSRLFPSRWYGAAWFALKHDRFADLRLRTLGGPAFGYLVFESEALNAAVETGPTVLRDDFYDHPDQDSLGWGWLLSYDQLVWQDRLQPYHRQFGYVALDGEDKHLWQSWTGLRVPLAGGFTGSVELEYDYDSDPAVAAKTTDTTLRLKLGYEW